MPIPFALALLSFLPAVARGSPPERPPGFVDAAAAVPGLSVAMMYAGSENFVGRPIAGYKRNLCLLTRAAAAELAAAEARLEALGRRRGLRLRLEARDCYRPRKATEDFEAWLLDPSSPGNRAEFFPETPKADILRLHYLSLRSAHSRGSTIDLTVLSTLADGSERELDMGTRVDFLGPASRTFEPSLRPAEKEARAWLLAAMGPNFENYPKEWWHFTLRREPYPATYFDFDVE